MRWVRQAAEGLAAAHAAGLVHRDIKPGNLWLEQAAPDAPPRVRVLDFGLARSDREVGPATLPGVLLGTPEYLAPEPARGEPADPPPALFPLGCVLYELPTGRSPFRRTPLLATLSALGNETPTDVRRLVPSIPPALRELLNELLQKRPERRPSAADVARR